jgi:hypothetical protein
MPKPTIDLPNVSTDAVFADHTDLGDRPFVVVDGPVLPGCALTLSHWPTAATPDTLAADTSTEIVERYLRTSRGGAEVSVVTNNHYDEDGVLGLWMLLERPSVGDHRRALAVAAAEAGDFRTWTDPSAAKVALALAALAERQTTPFPDVLRALSNQSGRNPAGAICAAVLPRVGALLDDPDRYERFWRPRWEAVERDVDLVDSGAVSIQEWPEVDLAVIRTPRCVDPLALYRVTECSRVLTLAAGDQIVLQDRYESWVRFVSRRVPTRVDLTELAGRFNDAETLGGGRWRYEGMQAITPRLLRSGSGGAMLSSGLDVDWVLEELIATYRNGDVPARASDYHQDPPMDPLP